MPHLRRPVLKSRNPVHVTVRAVSGLPTLRSRRAYRVIHRVFCAVRHGSRIRLNHYSVQSNHLHLILEAGDERALARGMQGLLVRLARNLNKLFERQGRFFSDRYHAHILKTPLEVRRALVYVFGNSRRHAQRSRKSRVALPKVAPTTRSALPATGGTSETLDPFSSAVWFVGWRGAPGIPIAYIACSDPRAAPLGKDDPRVAPGGCEVFEPRTYLLKVAWQRHGRLRFDE
jgi:putative transposase